MSFIPEIEKADIATQSSFQNRKLQETLQYLQLKSPFYQRLFAQYNINIDTINSIADMVKLPITTKTDLQLHNWDFLCVEKKDIVEITATSGTLGTPVFVALTQNDLDRLAFNEYLSFQHLNVTNNDSVQLMLTLDRQFMAGMAYYKGLNKLGATAIRTGAGLPEMQLDLIQKLQPEILVAVPSFLIKLIDYANSKGIDLNQTTVKKILAIGESLRTQELTLNALAKRIAQHWQVALYSTYASTEMQTAFTECNQFVGGHHHPELIIVELLNEEGQPVPPGQKGEVTITTLGIEGMPLLRYATGDVCIAHYEPCKCGRYTMRLGPVLGRKKQMIKFKGTTVFPGTIFEVLQEQDFIKDFVLELNTGTNEQDHITLHLNTNLSEDACNQLIHPIFKHKWRVLPQILYKSQSEIASMQFAGNSRKPIKIIDSRR